MESLPKVRGVKLGVGLNIAQIHASSLYEVIFDHYLLQFTWKVDQMLKYNYVKLDDSSKIAQTHSASL